MVFGDDGTSIEALGVLCGIAIGRVSWVAFAIGSVKGRELDRDSTGLGLFEVGTLKGTAGTGGVDTGAGAGVEFGDGGGVTAGLDGGVNLGMLPFVRRGGPRFCSPNPVGPVGLGRIEVESDLVNFGLLNTCS